MLIACSDGKLGRGVGRESRRALRIRRRALVILATASAQPTVKERLIRIQGGVPLRGTVSIGGAKNAALPAVAATLLTADECVLNNVPDLADIRTMTTLLAALGAEVEHDPARRRVRVRAQRITSTDAPPEIVRQMRASFLVAGPLLARFGEVGASTPGGCQLGARPVDVDVRGFRQMGADVAFEPDGSRMAARSVGLRGARIFMDYPSHTGTENLLMAATLASGRTRIVNASCEPEIVFLGNMLNRMGARISGLGSPVVTIEGVDRLHGVSETILPDRLEAGTFAIGAAITGGEVTLRSVHAPDMTPVTAKLREAGAEVWTDEDRMLVRAGGELRALEIQTLPFPGFPTDLQAAFAALMTQARGTSRLVERVFEDRLRYTDELCKLGADISVERHLALDGDGAPIPGAIRYGNRAEIVGPTRLRGGRVRCLDIRAGAGVVLAGLAAEGETLIGDPHHLDRGYESFVPKLRTLGARIDEIGAAD
ncbi:MAG: UDP-N-acetylglucosamine 1-carboxyvinyltransferase [Thermomicrobiales bacterium]|nr:UDP-N-acetylglucosamine 1-carboxyvinyltransferase [Thermomicrobiales bacterium]